MEVGIAANEDQMRLSMTSEKGNESRFVPLLTGESHHLDHFDDLGDVPLSCLVFFVEEHEPNWESPDLGPAGRRRD